MMDSDYVPTHFIQIPDPRLCFGKVYHIRVEDHDSEVLSYETAIYILGKI